MMLDIRDLSFMHAGASANSLEALEFSLDEGSLLCLCGINGSGKSTLLSLLAGLQRPTEGTLTVAGSVCPGAERDVRRAAALLLQDADMQILGSTVGEDLCLSLDPDDVGALASTRDLARRFGLEAHWDSPVHTLSYGQKRKLCLAGALLSGPRLLLLDEPFSGLDHPAIMELRGLLSAHKAAGLTQVVSVHDLEPVIDLADRLLVLDGGRQVLFGTPREVLDNVRRYGIRPPCSWRAGQGIVPYA